LNAKFINFTNGELISKVKNDDAFKTRLARYF
jgi:hypothetical protein